MSSIVVNGDTSGSVTLSAPATAGTVTVTLPSASGTMAVSGGSTSFTDLAYTGTLTGGTGVVNLGSGQVYKDASGNVGIGTSSPISQLHLNRASGTSEVRVQSGSAFGYSSLDNSGLYVGTGTAIPLILTTNNAERARIDSSGNVGIGTSSPAGRIQVNSAPGTIQIRWSDGTNGTANLDTASGLSRIYSNVALAFGTGADAFTERARIDSSGNLLVGQTALNGAGKVEISYDRASQWGMQIRNTTGTTAATTFIEFKYVNSTTGYISSTNGTSTTYNTSSDYRLKEDIAPMTGALAKVAALNPVTYKWKSTGMADEGFIAHELAEVCPSAVTGEKDAVDAEGNPQYQGIDTSFLVATLTAAIQEQQTLITALTARITALEGA